MKRPTRVLHVALGTGAALLSACSPGRQALSPPPDSSLLISNVVLVLPDENRLSRPQDVLVVDGTIVEVVAGGSVSPRRAASTLDGRGLYALPGLIDVHAHLGDGGIARQSQADRERALRQFLSYGVTTIFVPGGGGGNDHQLARWKERCRSGEITCPGLYGSGALITAPGSHPIATIWNFPPDVDPQAVYDRGAVAVDEEEPVGPLLDDKVALGADAIKIIIDDAIGPVYPMPRLSDDKVAELVLAAHQRGLRVFAHVSMASHVAVGVAGGVDGVMHSVDDPIEDALLAEMARQRIFYVATLALYDGFFDRAAGRSEQERYAHLGVSETALASLEGFHDSPFSPEEATATRSSVFGNLLRVASAGVPLALGTDVNNPEVFPGYSAHEELSLMVEAGLSPARALQAATTGGAAFLEQESTLGRIAPGFEADILLLSGNPLDDVSNTRRLRTVISDGRPAPGISLEVP